MKQIIFITALVFAFCLAAVAQASNCPEITVSLPDKPLIPDKTEIFSVKVGKNLEKLSFEWKTSAGRILKGQGTSEIEFVTSEEEEGANVNVTIKITGLSKDCPDTISDIIPILRPPITEPYEILGRHRSTKEGIKDYLSRIYVFLFMVKREPDSEGLITIVFEKKDNRNYKTSLLKKISKFLASIKFDLARITFAISDSDSGEKTIFWIVPPSAKFPKYVDKDYTVIKAEEFKQKIKDLFPKK